MILTSSLLLKILTNSLNSVHFRGKGGGEIDPELVLGRFTPKPEKVITSSLGVQRWEEV